MYIHQVENIIVRGSLCMTSSEKDYDRLFTIKRLRSILELSGAERISRTAVNKLDEVLKVYGEQIIKNALKSTIKNDRMELQTKDINFALTTGQQLKFHLEEKIFAHYVWIFRSNGTCLLSKSFSGMNFPDTLFTGLLMGIANMVQEVSGRTLDYLVLDDLVIHIKNRGDIYFCLCTETHQRKKVGHLLENLLSRFFERYDDIIDREVVNLNIFDPFSDTIEEELETAGMSIPTDILEKGEKTILSQQDIEDSVVVAALRKEIMKASQEIKKLPIFSSGTDSSNKVELTKNLKNLDAGNKELLQESQEALKKIKESNNNSEESG